MILGEPEYEDLSAGRRITYGYWSYSLPQSPSPPKEMDLADAAGRARAMGFEQLVILESTEIKKVPLR
jgi:hypothetical protein